MIQSSAPGTLHAQLELSADQSSVTVLAGGQHILGLGIRNLGGVAIEVAIGAHGVPGNWVSINPPRLVLGPGQSAAVGCCLTPPVDTPAANYLISFTASDPSNPAVSARLALPVEIGAPGLSAAGSSPPLAQAQASAGLTAAPRQAGQIPSSRTTPWLLVWGAIVLLALVAAAFWAGPTVARQLGWGATPTRMAVFLMSTTNTPPPTAAQPKPKPPTSAPVAVAGESQALDPCSPLIVSPDEAKAILGQAVTPGQAVSGGCAFNNAGDRLYAVSAAAGQNDQAANIMMAQAMLVNLGGVQFDAAQTDKLRKLAAPATAKDYFTELVSRTQGATSIKAHLVDGIGDGAYWAWLSGGSRPEGALVVWRGGTLVNVNAVVPAVRQEAEILTLTQDQALKMLNRLPPSFNIGQPQQANLVPGQTPLSAPTFTSVPPPTATVATRSAAPKPSPSRSPTATTVAAPPGVYALGLHAAPPQPQNGQGVIFIVTFLNTTGSQQYFRWCVESFRQDGKSHGITACKPARTIAAGRTELSTTDPYVGQKLGPCLPLRARVIWESDQKQRIPFTLPDGSDLWLPYQFCPA